jgi:hypothetical protein
MRVRPTIGMKRTSVRLDPPASLPLTCGDAVP